MPDNYSPASATHRRIVKDAARAAIRDWLRGLQRRGMYFFSVDGVECALEHTTGYWGFEESARWRWGRVDSGDADDNLSGEDALLEVALGRPLPPNAPAFPRRRQKAPEVPEGANLPRAEIKAQAAARARENLDKLVLRRLPSI